MSTLAAAGVLADKLGVDLRTPPKFIHELPTVAPCRCQDARGRHDPRLWRSEPERCGRCGRWLDEFIGTEYEGFDLDGLAKLAARVAHEQDKVRQEFEDCGATDYEAYLVARLAAADRELDRLCGRAS